jgi:hypothetical protein
MNEKWKNKQTADRFKNIIENITKLNRAAVATHVRLYIDRESKVDRCRCHENKGIGTIVVSNCRELTARNAAPQACGVTKCPLLQVPGFAGLTQSEKEIVDISIRMLSLRKAILSNATLLFDSAAQFCCYRSPKSSTILNTRTKTIQIYTCLVDIKKGIRFVRPCGIGSCNLIKE